MLLNYLNVLLMQEQIIKLSKWKLLIKLRKQILINWKELEWLQTRRDKKYY